VSYRRSSARTTLGWSLLTSGVVTLVLTALPGDDLWWGVGLVAVGIAVMLLRS
jgi:predicted small integral membrane protein